MSEIPNIFHFCYFGGLPFSLINYLAVKSAYEVNKPDKIFMYIDNEPEGEWFGKAKQYLTIVPTQFPDEVFGVPIPNPAHKADVIRLQKLIEMGGIYLDWDVICVKPFTPLLDYRVVLGEEVYNGNKVGLCNAVILARPEENFIKRWFAGFNPRESLWKGFRSKGNDIYYSEISVKYPFFLSMIYTEEVHVESYKSFYYPSYYKPELEEFFTKDTDRFGGSYCHHLWTNATYGQYLKDISLEKILAEETAFTKLVRKFLL